MSLYVCAAIYGVFAGFVFQRFVDARKLKEILRRMAAHVMEFALFADEPSVVFQAQRDLLRANLRLLRLIALPCLAIAIPLILLYPAMERRFSARTGNVLTLPMGSALPAGAVVETPRVRIPRTNEVSWRVRPGGSKGGNHWRLRFSAVSAMAALVAAAVRGKSATQIRSAKDFLNL